MVVNAGEVNDWLMVVSCQLLNTAYPMPQASSKGVPWTFGEGILQRSPWDLSRRDPFGAFAFFCLTSVFLRLTSTFSRLTSVFLRLIPKGFSKGVPGTFGASTFSRLIPCHRHPFPKGMPLAWGRDPPKESLGPSGHLHY